MQWLQASVVSLSHNMHMIISAFCLAESMYIYPKQCKNVKSRVQKFEFECKQCAFYIHGGYRK